MSNIDVNVDVLADTTLCDRAVAAVDQLVQECGYLVSSTQIHGLRQIAINQPSQVKKFADHQRERAERKAESLSSNARQKTDGEIQFWQLVAHLCEGTAGHSEWSLLQEAEKWMPDELRKQNIPEKQKGMSPEEWRQRKDLKNRRKQWISDWYAELIPPLFQRFAAHYVYRLSDQDRSKS